MNQIIARSLCAAAAATFVLVLAGSPAVAGGELVCPGYEELLFCGDLNGDCDVTAVDALSGLRMAVGQIPSVQQADLDLANGVTAPDALKILQIAVGSRAHTYSCDPEHIVLEATASGFYRPAGGHVANNYAVGWYNAASAEELRDYFVFDLSAVQTTILSAKLRVSTVGNNSALYPSKDPSETFQLVAVDTSIATLSGGTGGTAAYDDLADGTEYASLVVVPLGIKPLLEVPLNGDGVAALNATAGSIALGGSITTLTKGATGEYLFNATGTHSTRQLILSIAPVL